MNTTGQPAILGPDGRPLRTGRASARLDDRLAVRQKQLALLEATRRLRAQKILKARQKKLLESYDAFEWLGAYSDGIDRMRGPDRDLALPISTAMDRRYGDNWPFWRSWVEHSRLRAAARLLCQLSPLASGAIGAVRAYVIGKGMQVRPIARQPDCPKALLQAVTELISEFEKANNWGAVQRELFFRDRRDGEYFLRVFPQDDGMVLVRPVEPTHIVEPPGFSRDEASYGIFTDPEDLLDVRGFWVAPDGNSANGEYVHAAGRFGPLERGSSIYHHKVNVDLDVKRGLPDFAFDTGDLYKTVGRLLENMGQGAAIQAAIAFVRQHQVAPPDMVNDFTGATADYQATVPFTGQSRNVMRFEAGTVIDMDAGQEFKEAPFAANVGNYTSCVQALLRACAVRWNAPEWIVSADNSSVNFASSLVAEAPFVRFCESTQDEHRVIFQGVIDQYLAHWCRRRGGVRVEGRLYNLQALRHYVDIQVTAPSVQARDRGQEATRNKTLVDMKVKSPQTVAQEEGLNWETEARNLEQFDEQFGEQQGGPGGGDPMAAMMGAMGGEPGGEQPGGEEQQAGAAPGTSSPDDPQAGAAEAGPGPDIDLFGDDDAQDIDELLAQLAGGEEGEEKDDAQSGQQFSESLIEGNCVRNQSGKGFHDEDTGHPCSPDKAGGARTGRIASTPMPGRQGGKGPVQITRGKIAVTPMPGQAGQPGKQETKKAGPPLPPASNKSPSDGLPDLQKETGGDALRFDFRPGHKNAPRMNREQAAGTHARALQKLQASPAEREAHGKAYEAVLGRMPTAAVEAIGQVAPIYRSMAALTKAAGRAIKVNGKVVGKLTQSGGKPVLAFASDSGLPAKAMAHVYAAALALAAPPSKEAAGALAELGIPKAKHGEAMVQFLRHAWSGSISSETLKSRLPGVHKALKSQGLLESRHLSPDGSHLTEAGQPKDGEFKDRAGRRICYSQGRRVACGRAAEPAGKQKKEAGQAVRQVAGKAGPGGKAGKPTPEAVEKHIQALRSSGKAITHDDLQNVATMLSALTVPQIKALREKLAIQMKVSGKKAELVERLKEKALGGADEPKPAPAKAVPAKIGRSEAPSARPAAARPSAAPTAPVAPSRSAVTKNLSEGRLQKIVPLGGGINDSFVAHLEDGSKGVFKPGRLKRMNQGSQMDNEVAASEIADVLGLGDLVPATTHRKAAPGDAMDELYEEVGSVQAFVPDAKMAIAVMSEGETMWGKDAKDVARAAAFDYLIGSTDRHAGNWMVNSAGKIALIDNGQSFSIKHGIGANELLKKARGDKLGVPAEVKNWDWGKIEAIMKQRGIGASNIAAARERFDSLVSLARSGGSLAEVKIG